MTLQSALEDLKGTTLAAVSGVLGKLAYLASLRRGHGRYEHWGMEMVHGVNASQQALKAVHAEVVATVLQTPLPLLLQDLDQSSRNSGVSAREYVEGMQTQFRELLPEVSKNSPTALHLNSVLVALSSLKKHPGRATRLTS